jgi:hypothetical protein
MKANLMLLEGQFTEAKELYRKGLRTVKSNERLSMLLNNIAYASW